MAACVLHARGRQQCFWAGQMTWLSALCVANLLLLFMAFAVHFMARYVFELRATFISHESHSAAASVITYDCCMFLMRVVSPCVFYRYLPIGYIWYSVAITG